MYGTKLAAICMMFEPIRFVGIQLPYHGWQGVNPRNAERMAIISCDTLTARRPKPEELFARLEPSRVALEVHQPWRFGGDHDSRGRPTGAPELWRRALQWLRQRLMRPAVDSRRHPVRQLSVLLVRQVSFAGNRVVGLDPRKR